MFRVGDLIFYPMHGAGLIEAIEEKEILGECKLYYVLNIPLKNVQIMIPVDKAAEFGMRRVVTPEVLEDVLNGFYDGNTDPDIFENQRYCLSLNKTKIKSGDIYQVTEIIRDLMRKSKRSKLGTEDRNMLDSARQILVNEVAHVKGIDEQEAGHLLDEVIEREEKIANL
jgi:CarD family transcriptional regulator